MNKNYIKQVLDLNNIELNALVNKLQAMKYEQSYRTKQAELSMWVPASKPLVYKNRGRARAFRAYVKNQQGEEMFIGQTTTLRQAVALQMKELEKTP